MPEPMRVLMVTPECVPFAKTGGLADVLGSLPAALRQLGHDVRVVMPRYRDVDGVRHALRPVLAPLGVWMGDRLEWCAVQGGFLPGEVDVPVYFIEFDRYFHRPGLYHDPDFRDYGDNAHRFAFLARAALQLCRDLPFDAQVVHAHDWQGALAPAYLKVWHWDDPRLGGAASVLTLHNLGYQGVHDAADYPYIGLQWANFTPERFEDHGRVNFLKGGIHFADEVTTVSPTYARETLEPGGGEGMAPFLSAKGEHYTGILNGIDYTLWNPATDPFLPARYNPADMSGKAICKAALQRRLGLAVRPEVPLFGAIGRFVPQKGFDLLADAIPHVMSGGDAQFAVLGSGEKDLEHRFRSLQGVLPGRVGSHIGHDEEMAHWVEAGSDFLIMPSRYEPCGLNQLYALGYGTLPVVRATGGLVDTVTPLSPEGDAGTGFRFYPATVEAVQEAIGEAVRVWGASPDQIQALRSRAMAQRFDWARSAAEYERLYRRALAGKR